MMPGDYNIQRFLDAQRDSYSHALAEIKNGHKRSHWMWYVFPQLIGLGSSEMSRHYGIKNIVEAGEYLKHPVLGKRLIEICTALLDIKSNDAQQVFGSPDDMKLRSSMTLFSEVAVANPVFEKILQKFFKGERDMATCRLLNNR